MKGAALPFVFFCLLSAGALAQAPSAGSAGGQAGSGAPGGNAPAPGVSGGLPNIAPGRPLTLAEVVAFAVGSNSSLVLARQRLQKAQELIAQVNAQVRPQLRADANDTYSSYSAFAPTLPSPAIANPVLPGGGAIPTVIDQANAFSTTFLSGIGAVSGSALSGATGTPAIGGAGTPGVGATGASGTSSTGTTPSLAPTTPLPGSGTAPGIGAPGSPNAPAPATPGTGTPAPGTGGTGTPVPAPPAPGSGGASGAAPTAFPPIVADYVTDRNTLTEPPARQTQTVVRTETARPAAASEVQPRQTGTTGTGGGNGNGSATGAVSAGGAARGQRNAYATRLSVSQYLDVFGLASAARGAQDEVRNFYALDIPRLQNETALAAKNLFFNVLLAQAQVETQQEQVAYAQEDVRITESRLRQGIVSRLDVLTAQTALATAQQQLIAAQDQLGLAQSNLSFLLGTDPDRPLTLVTPPLPPLDQAVDLRQSTQVALRQRPELGQAADNVRAAQRLVRVAASGLLPIVGVVGSGEYNSLTSTTTPRSYATVSAEVAVPLDDGGATRSRVRSARVDVQTQAVTRDQLALAVSLEVRQAAINVRSAQAQIGAAQSGVTRAAEALRIARERYGAGLGTFLDILNALALLATTRTNLANAEYFYQTSLAQLVRAMGGR